MSKFHLVCAIAVSMFFSSAAAIRCYNCINVKVEDDTTPLLKNVIETALDGLSITDPNCGSNPSASNTMTCKYGEVCGSITGYMSAKVLLFGFVHVQTQLRTCINAVSGPLGGCQKAGNDIKTIVEDALDLGTAYVLSDFNIDGQVCTCNSDLCRSNPNTTPCDGGLVISTVCIVPWMIGVTAAGVVVILILLITSCCCCCGCCRKSSSTTTVILPPTAMPAATVMSMNQCQNSQGYSNPGQGYSQPGQGYSQPGQGYSNPGQGYSQPGQGYSQPGQGYYNPGQNHSNQYTTANDIENRNYSTPTIDKGDPVGHTNGMAAPRYEDINNIDYKQAL